MHKIKLLNCRFLLVIIIITTLHANAFPQQLRGRNEAPPLKERLFFGGNFGLQLGSYSYVEVSPLVGLWLLPRFAVAAGPSFKYMSDPAGKTDVWGGKSYARLVVVNDINSFIPIGINMAIFLQTEYEALSFRSDWLTTTPEHPRTIVQTSFAGFGISQRVGRRGTVDFTILWTMTHSGYDIYTNPEYRIGFTF
ncbi:MAG TPA: hypothetical protein VMW76_04785 [Bacteroidales bacterium]|nr:hypothetical protein [Bacteroidales bacterium]